METPRGHFRLTKFREASIGPRIFLRGNQIFNDMDQIAIAALQLGHGFFSVETASYNYHTIDDAWLQLGHGFFSVETVCSRSALSSSSTLQLGHGFFSVETNSVPVATASASAASIGPRIFLRGNRSRRRPWRSIASASIGPRIFLRGNRQRYRLYSLAALLLQLGHGFFSVETCLQTNFVCRVCKRFNWATDFSPWKPSTGVVVTAYLGGLQLGHGFFSVETK